MKGLTLNHDSSIGHPYASRGRYDEPLPIPYGDAGGTHERLTATSSICKGHTCGEQPRATRRQRPSTQRAENGKMTKKNTDRRSLTFIPRTGHNVEEAGHTHELEDDLGLKHVTCQNAGAHDIDNGHNVPRNCIRLSSQYPPG